MNNFISFAVVAIMLSVPLFSLSAFGAEMSPQIKVK